MSRIDNVAWIWTPATHYTILINTGQIRRAFSSAQLSFVQFSSVQLAAVQSCSDQLILVVVEGGGSNSADI